MWKEFYLSNASFLHEPSTTDGVVSHDFALDVSSGLEIRVSVVFSSVTFPNASLFVDSRNHAMGTMIGHKSDIAPFTSASLIDVCSVSSFLDGNFPSWVSLNFSICFMAWRVWMTYQVYPVAARYPTAKDAFPIVFRVSLVLLILCCGDSEKIRFNDLYTDTSERNRFK